MQKQQRQKGVDEVAKSLFQDSPMAVLAGKQEIDKKTVVRMATETLQWIAQTKDHVEQFVWRRQMRGPDSLLPDNLAADEGCSWQSYDEAVDAVYGALDGEQIEKSSAGELLRVFVRLLNRTFYALAEYIFLLHEQQVESGEIGYVSSQSQETARCILPRQSQEADRVSSVDLIMMAALEETSEGADEAPVNGQPHSVDMFVDERAALSAGRGVRKRVPVAEQIFETATKPLQPFLQVMSGTPFRRSDNVSGGQFHCILFFHYILAHSTDGV